MTGWRGPNYQTLYQPTERIPETMSQAIWCDKGDHAFSSKDPERQHFAQTQTVPVQTGNTYGRPTIQDRVQVTEEIDICGPCWKSGGVMAQKEIPPQTLDDMQRESDTWQAGYDAAMEKVLNRPMTTDEKDRLHQ